LEQNFGRDYVVHQYQAEWCRNNRYLPYDIAVIIGGSIVIVEVDGAQHFKDVAYWDSTADTQRERDTFKTFAALQCPDAVPLIGLVRVKGDDAWKSDAIIMETVRIVQEMFSQKDSPKRTRRVEYVANDDAYHLHKQDMLDAVNNRKTPFYPSDI
jgi:hypothetical protein